MQGNIVLLTLENAGRVLQTPAPTVTAEWWPPLPHHDAAKRRSLASRNVSDVSFRRSGRAGRDGSSCRIRYSGWMRRRKAIRSSPISKGRPEKKANSDV